MRVAFYAPLKPPDHPVPSGDRRMAGLLVEALTRAGHEVELASRLRSRDGAGDAAYQARLERVGAAMAERLGVRAGRVSVEAGAASPAKTVRLSGVRAGTVSPLLARG